jgi:DNA-binding MarR family transcriptional regulator
MRTTLKKAARAKDIPSPQLKEIFPLIFEVGCRMKQAMRQAYAGAGNLPLSPVYVGALYYISGNPNPTMRNIAEYLCVTAPSASELVNELVSKGLLVRREDPKDRRIVRISLSPAGKAFLVKVLKLREEMLHGFLSRLSRVDQKELARILSILVKK